MKLSEAIDKQRVVAIFPGRYNPYSAHHHTAYQNLVAKFGVKNVYVATSNVTGPKSPFTFAEKKIIISAAGVPSSKIVKVKNPYKAEEITSKLPDDTAVVFAVGAKDGSRLVSGKYFDKYKDGKKLDGYKEHGYIYIIPHVALKIRGKELSGTSVRAALGDKGLKAPEKRKLFKGIFGHDKKDIYKLVVDKLTRLSEEKMELRGLSNVRRSLRTGCSIHFR